MMINRTIQPLIRQIEKPALAEPSKIILNNGLPVYLLQAGTQDVCRIDFIFEAGTWQQEVPLQASLCNAMLEEGSKNFSSARIAEAFDFRGAHLQLTADQHYGIISIVSLTKHLPKLMPVVEDLIKHSTFPENEFETLVQRRKQRFLLENEKVKVICHKKFTQVLFGEGHPYSLELKAEDFDQLELSSLVSFYREQYHAGNCEILVSGQFDDSAVSLISRHFGENDWSAGRTKKSSFKTSSALKRFHRKVKEDSIQSAIRIGKLMVCKNHPDYLPLQVLVTILGGYFSSRLMENIREEKGYTYGIGASLLCMKEAGYLTIATEVDKTYEQATIDEIFRELKRLREEPVGQEELDRVRQYLLGEFVRDIDGPFALADAFRNIHSFGLGYDYYETYYQTLLHITPEKLQQLAQTYFAEDSFYTVVAGQE